MPKWNAKLNSPDAIIQHFTRDPERAGYQFTVPSYTLDYKFQYIDWNYAFDEIVARPLGINLGMHGTYLLSCLTNCEDVTKRSMQVFAAGKHPITDHETMIIDHPIYGDVYTLKMATQILDDRGLKNAWALSLNIYKCEKFDQIFADLMKRLERETLLGAVGGLFDQLFIHHADFRPFIDRLTQAAKGPNQLVMGAISPELVSSLYQFGKGGEILVVEPNDQILQMLRKKLSKTPSGNRLWEPPSLLTSKGFFDRMQDLGDNSLDSVVGLELLTRLHDAPKAFAEIFRTLNPGGNLVLSFFSPQTQGATLNTLLSTLPAFDASREDARNILDSFSQYFDQLRNIQSPDEIANVVAMLGKAGFKITRIGQDFFDGQMCVIEAKKPTE